MQEHLIFGAGLIGSYLGGCLTSKGIKTQLLCRPAFRKQLQDGITLSNYASDLITTAKVNFCEHPSHFDVIWLTVKCTSVESACAELSPYVSSNTLILCCQNGLGSEKIVKRHFPNNSTLRVMVPFNVVALKEGHFHRGSEGYLTVEKNQQNTISITKMIDTINSEILPVTATSDMSALLWAKLQLNLGNSINALADMPVKTMLEQRPYRLIIAAMMDELLAVTNTKNIVLPKITALPAGMIPKVLRLPNFLFKLLANKMLAIDPTVRTSMWWDIHNAKKSEIDYLNGAIVNQANQFGLTCPVNEKVIELVKMLEKSAFDGKNKEKPSFSGKQLLHIVKQI